MQLSTWPRGALSLSKEELLDQLRVPQTAMELTMPPSCTRVGMSTRTGRLTTSSRGPIRLRIRGKNCSSRVFGFNCRRPVRYIKSSDWLHAIVRPCTGDLPDRDQAIPAVRHQAPTSHRHWIGNGNAERPGAWPVFRLVGCGRRQRV